MKKMLRLITVITLNVLFILFFRGCPDSSTNVIKPNGGKIETGSTVESSNSTVGKEGGVISVKNANDSLNGLELTISKDAFSESRNIRISYAPISSHTFGENFNPVSPLITISNGGGYSNKLMYLRIPVKIPDGHIAMAFYYNKKNGLLEGIPTMAMDANSITIATRHFDVYTNTKTLKSKYFTEIMSEDEVADIVVSSIPISKIKGMEEISTDYEPGDDDWEFPNHGSYIASGGHCAGQSIASIWYYYNKRLEGESALYHKYDSPTIAYAKQRWEDNPYGYRLCSVVQNDFDFDIPTFLDYWDNFIKDKSKDSLGFYALCYSMLITKSPQLIFIRRDGGGHCIVAHKVWVKDGEIWITDPNKPADRSRSVWFLDGEFDPYSGAENATSSDRQYPWIGYGGTSAFINWQKISERWTEFENKTIGTKDFPDYSLLYLDDEMNEVDLTDEMKFNKDSITVLLKCPDCEKELIVGTGIQAMYVYDAEGKEIASSVNNTDPGYAKFKLEPGKNTYGFYLTGGKSISGEPTKFKTSYLDYKWIDIQLSMLKIIKPDMALKKDTSFTFKANAFGTAPSNVKFEWEIKKWEQTAETIFETTKNNDSTISYTFNENGDYSISLSMFDAGLNKFITADTIYFKVGESLIDKLKQAKKAWYCIIGMGTGDTNSALILSDGTPLGWMNFMNANDEGVPVSSITWNKNSFTADYSYNGSNSLFDSEVTGTIQGEFSDDGTLMKSGTATINIIAKYIGSGKTMSDTKSTITIINAPVEECYYYNICVGNEFKASQVQQYVSSFTYKSTVYLDDTNTKIINLSQILWNDSRLKFTIYFTGD